MPHLALPAPSTTPATRRARAAVNLGLLVVALVAGSAGSARAAVPASAGAPRALLQAAALRADTVARVVTVQTPRATRAELTAALERAERTASQSTGGARDRAQSEAASIRVRLRVGDFQTGDRIALSIGGDTTRREATVREGVQIDLPYGIPSLPLAGVLRSELASAVEAHLRKYVREPDVRARALQRMNVTGAVLRPGVYWTPLDAPVSELVTLAGGLGGSSRTDRITVLRGGRQIVDRGAYARLVREGRTVEDAGLQPGDEVRVPERGGRNVGQTVTYAFFAISALTAVLALIRSSYQ
jgi:hypothetical protein